MKIISENRKVRHEYFVLDEYSCGIVLTGNEVKSIRLHSTSIKESYCYFNNGELYVKGMFVGEYHNNSFINHEPYRDRKLLLNKKELVKLKKELKVKGISLVPKILYFNDKGLAKLGICLVKGKKLWNKKEDQKTKDLNRELQIKIK